MFAADFLTCKYFYSINEWMSYTFVFPRQWNLNSKVNLQQSSTTPEKHESKNAEKNNNRTIYFMLHTYILYKPLKGNVV